MKTLHILLIVFFHILSCSDNGTDPTPNPKLSFSPEMVTISNNSQTEITLSISDLATEIFALSMQLNYNANILSFDENGGFSVGDFFGQNEINLVKTIDNNIHLSISLTQETSPVKGTGVLGIFTLKGISTGNCTLSIKRDELIFYDNTGRPIEIPDLSLVSSSIYVK